MNVAGLIPLSTARDLAANARPPSDLSEAERAVVDRARIDLERELRLASKLSKQIEREGRCSRHVFAKVQNVVARIEQAVKRIEEPTPKEPWGPVVI